MSTNRNFVAIFVLSVFYMGFTILFAPQDWIYKAILPTVIAVVGYYLASGPVWVRGVVCAMAPFVALPVLSIPFSSDTFRIIIAYAVIHAVLIGAFLGLLWGHVDRRLRGKRHG